MNDDVFALGPDHPIRRAHAHSIHHRAEIERSGKCGCFHCLATFEPARITSWTDTNEAPERHAALCPICCIDSIIGDAAGVAITPDFLAEMKLWWFGGAEET